MSDRIVIVGAGHAGTQAAMFLRQNGHSGAIAVVSQEDDAPYQRPPLSKKYLTGDLTDAQIALRPEQWFTDNDVLMYLGTQAVELDLDEGLVTLGDGEELKYDRLLLATGSRLRRLEVPGADLPGVHYLRTAADSRSLAAALAKGERVAVIGGGYIGLEVAASARQMGKEVTVLERAGRLLPRVASNELANAVARLHAREGVTLRYDANVTAVAGDEHGVRAVVLDGGEEVPADVVVVGIGVTAETALAEEAGLRVDDGIVVDEYCQTSNPRVYAAGDCTSHPNRFVRHRVRLESVPNATQQARTAAAAMTGTLTPYTEAPWFWSEQYSVRMQAAGLPDARYETVLRGDPASDAFALFHLEGDRLMGVEALNRVQEFMFGRKLIDAQVQVDERLADESESFKTIAEALLGAGS